jgi:hypothetical protein
MTTSPAIMARATLLPPIGSAGLLVSVMVRMTPVTRVMATAIRGTNVTSTSDAAEVAVPRMFFPLVCPVMTTSPDVPRFALS